MQKIVFLIKILIIYVFFFTNVFALNKNYFDKGEDLFKKKKFQESKFFFEKDLVFDPKSEKSYLYLAKIYEKDKNDELEELNLNNVLLLNPKNEEAIYMLILLKIKQSDYSATKEWMEKFTLICKSFCTKEKEIKEKFEKLKP